MGQCGGVITLLEKGVFCLCCVLSVSQWSTGDRGVLELDFGLRLRSKTVGKRAYSLGYFGIRGFVWEVGEFQFCYVVGSLKYKKKLSLAQLSPSLFLQPVVRHLSVTFEAISQ